MKGFSLYELMWVLLIIGMLSLLSIKGMHQLDQKLESKRVAYLLKQALEDAYTIALVYPAKTIVLCPTLDKRVCLAGKNADWVIASLREDGHLQRIFSAYSFKLKGRLFWSNFQKHPYWQFHADDLAGLPNGRFVYCLVRGQSSLNTVVLINRVGRVRVAPPRESARLAEKFC